MTRQRKIIVFFGLLFVLAFFMSACTAEDSLTVTGLVDYEMLLGEDVPDVLEGLALEGATLEDVTVDTSGVQTDKVGTYVVTVTIAPDDMDEVVKEVTVKVNAPKNPIIEGATDLEYYINGPVPPRIYDGVTVFDYEYGDLTHLLQFDNGTVNLGVPGVYEAFYYVENIDGYSSRVKVNYHVILDDSDLILPDEYIIVEQNGLMGLKNIDGSELLEMKYDNIQYMGDQMLMLTSGYSSYLYNGLTQEIILYSYDYDVFGVYSEGLVRVRNDEYLYGYMDTSGEITIPFMYTYADNFVDGLAKVSLGSNNMGMIDQDNNMRLPFIYSYISRDYVYSFTMAGYSGANYLLDDDLNIGLELSSGTRYVFTDYADELRYAVYIDGSRAVLDEDMNILAYTGDYYCSEYNELLNIGYNGVSSTFYFKNNDVVVTDVTSYEQYFDTIIYHTVDGVGAFNATTGEIILEPEYTLVEMLPESESSLLVRNNEGLLGVVSDDGEVLFDFEATSLLPKEANGLFFYRDSINYYGLLNENGEKITNQTYYSIDYFSEGKSRYRETPGGLYGYLNENGEEEMPPTFYSAYRYVDGFAVVKRADQEDGWTVMDQNNTYITIETYYAISPTDNGYFSVQTLSAIDGYGIRFMDQFGDLLDGTYSHTTGFLNGYANVGEFGNPASYGVIDTSGDFIVPFGHKWISRVYDEHIRVYCANNLYGFYDVDGNLTSACEYTTADDYNVGRAVVTNSIGQYALIDEDGNFVIEFQENVLFTAYDGMVAFRDTENTNDYGYYDIDGNVVIEPTFSSPGYFSNGLAAMFGDNGKQGYINKTGELVVDYIYDVAVTFDENGYALVRDSGGWGIINLNGEEVLESSYDIIYAVDGGYILQYDYLSEEFFVFVENGILSYEVQDNTGTTYNMVFNDGWQVEDVSGTVLIPNGFDRILYHSGTNTWITYKDGKMGYYNSNFVKVLDPEFDNYDVSDESLFVRVYANNSVGIYSLTGDAMLEPIYDEIYVLENYNVILVRIGDVYGLYDMAGNEILSMEYSSIQYIIEELD